MGRQKEVSFRVPAGSKLNVYELVKFYRAPSEYHTEYVGTEDGYDVYKATVSSNSGGSYYYTVAKEKCVTTSAVFGKGASPSPWRRVR